MVNDDSHKGEAEEAIDRAGLGPQFRDSLVGLTGDRETLAYMFLSGAAAHAVVIQVQLREVQSRMPAHVMAGLR